MRKPMGYYVAKNSEGRTITHRDQVHWKYEGKKHGLYYIYSKKVFMPFSGTMVSIAADSSPLV